MENQIYQLLVDGSTAAYIVEDWWSRNYDFDLRVRRAKTKGKVVIELNYPLYAQHIVQNFGAKVHIKEPNK